MILLRNFWLYFVLGFLLVSLCNSADLRKHFRDDDDDDDECDWECVDERLGDGAIAGIVITVLVVFFGIPILLCFCCAWCCFRNRRKGVPSTVVAVTAPAPQYISQPYQNQSTGRPHHTIFTNSQGPYKSAVHYNNQFPTGNTVQVPTTNEMSHIYERPPPYYDVTNSSSVPQNEPIDRTLRTS